jgi:predicted lipoprotein with Yx(FWY)xxD motif
MVDDAAKRRTARIATGFAVILLVAGCGSGGSASTASSTARVAGASSSARSVQASGPVSVAATTGPLGVYLVDGAGRTLYVFDADSAGTPTCVDACATDWPPLTGVGKPTAAAGAAVDKLSTVGRADGSTQVRYAGQPLYYYAGDVDAGQTNGAGSDGKWWIVGPDGSPIRSGADQADPGGMPGGGY